MSGRRWRSARAIPLPTRESASIHLTRRRHSDAPVAESWKTGPMISTSPRSSITGGDSSVDVSRRIGAATPHSQRVLQKPLSHLGERWVKDLNGQRAESIRLPHPGRLPVEQGDTVCDTLRRWMGRGKGTVKACRTHPLKRIDMAEDSILRFRTDCVTRSTKRRALCRASSISTAISPIMANRPKARAAACLADRAAAVRRHRQSVLSRLAGTAPSANLPTEIPPGSKVYVAFLAAAGFLKTLSSSASR